MLRLSWGITQKEEENVLNLGVEPNITFSYSFENTFSFANDSKLHFWVLGPP